METMQILWLDLGARIRRFVSKRVNDAHAADDITQDVLLKVQTQLDALPAEDKLPAWVFQVARNAIVDYYRSRAIRDHADLANHEPVEEPSDSDQAQALRELAPCLVRMVEQLPEPYREAMKLADFQGLSQQAIADRAGISLSGAKSRVQRARSMLREMIHDCCRIEQDSRGNVIDFAPTERSARYCGDAGCPPV
ncbi:MAG TPA: RNA polymerase sigma factor SigZ [Tepidisphaeraceae bacterium]|nr:RNA polymerase sigma factor SigZ [Tepidisphaeraceae bacterium]